MTPTTGNATQRKGRLAMAAMSPAPIEPGSASAPGFTPGLAATQPEITIVRLCDIRLHEEHDPERTERLAAAIAADRCQRHPVILGRIDGAVLVHLDGATRIKALEQLRCGHVAAQIVDYGDDAAISLQTWSHLTRLSRSSLHRLASSGACALEPLRADGAIPGPDRQHYLVTVLFSDGSTVGLACAAPVGARLDLIETLLRAYELPPVRDIIEPNRHPPARDLFQRHPAANAAVSFGAFEKHDIRDIALGDQHRFPPGITRHIVNCGRVLHVNAPLSLLQSASSSAEKRRYLAAMLATRQRRIYQEATIQFER